MKIEKEVRRKRMLSLFVSLLLVLCVAGLSVDSCEKKSLKQKKSDALLNSRYGAAQVAYFKDLFSRKNMSPEEYDQMVSRIADRAVQNVRYRQKAKEVSEIIYANLLDDLYLASEKWGIKDDEKLARIQSRLSDIAEEEIDLHLARYMGEIGINHMMQESDNLYKERLGVIEDYLPDEKKHAYSEMKKSVDNVFEMKKE